MPEKGNSNNNTEVILVSSRIELALNMLSVIQEGKNCAVNWLNFSLASVLFRELIGHFNRLLSSRETCEENNLNMMLRKHWLI